MSCQGLSLEEIVDRINEAAHPVDLALAQKIQAAVTEYQKLPELDLKGNPVLDEQGQPVHRVHHFCDWIHGLRAGSWRLPVPLPREVLEGFTEVYGAVLWRCEDCRTGLGNGSRYPSCPVCGSKHVSCKKISGPPWDPAWIYTPLPASLTWQRRTSS